MEDLFFDELMILINKGKGGKSRYVPILAHGLKRTTLELIEIAAADVILPADYGGGLPCQQREDALQSPLFFVGLRSIVLIHHFKFSSDNFAECLESEIVR